jgi:hypothetical protein
MELKPRIATKIAMIIGGLLFSIGLPFGFDLGGVVGLVPAAVGLLGIFWISVATYALMRRKKMRIVVDATGVEVPTDGGRLLLQREEIQSIEKHESLKGRVIQILMEDGRQFILPMREYCELNDFIAYCRNYGLPA